MTHWSLKSLRYHSITYFLIFSDLCISSGVITRKKLQWNYLQTRSDVHMTVQLLYCGSSGKTRKLHAHKDFDVLQSNDRENLKIIIVMNKFGSKVGFLKNSLCKLALTYSFSKMSQDQNFHGLWVLAATDWYLRPSSKYTALIPFPP